MMIQFLKSYEKIQLMNLFLIPKKKELNSKSISKNWFFSTNYYLYSLYSLTLIQYSVFFLDRQKYSNIFHLKCSSNNFIQNDLICSVLVFYYMKCWLVFIHSMILMQTKCIEITIYKSDEGADFIRKLFDRDPQTMLGYPERDYEELKEYLFFK